MVSLFCLTIMSHTKTPVSFFSMFLSLCLCLSLFLSFCTSLSLFLFPCVCFCLSFFLCLLSCTDKSIPEIRLTFFFFLPSTFSSMKSHWTFIQRTIQSLHMDISGTKQIKTYVSKIDSRHPPTCQTCSYTLFS